MPRGYRAAPVELTCQGCGVVFWSRSSLPPTRCPDCQDDHNKRRASRNHVAYVRRWRAALSPEALAAYHASEAARLRRYREKQHGAGGGGGGGAGTGAG